MAVTADRVVVELEAKLDRYNAGVKNAERQFTKSMLGMGAAAEINDKQIAALAKRYEKLGAQIGNALVGASRNARIAFAAITAYSLKLAADAGEIESAFGVAFGSATADARAFSDALANQVGRDAVALREKMTRLQLVLTGTGVAAQQATQLVKALTAAGVDAGSLFNTSDAEAMQKIISGLTGETEPLKAFGVVITEAAVKTELLRLGFKGNAEAASESAKSIARANLILKGLSVAQGDATRTADSAANKTKALTAEFNKAARELGEQLIPAFVKVAGAATDTLKAFNELPGGVQVAGLAFLGLIAAGGPIAGVLANLAKVIKLARDTKIALAGIGGASAAAGAAGVAGAAAGALGVATGAAVLTLSGDTASDKSAEGRIRRLRGEIKGLQRDLEVFSKRGNADLVAGINRNIAAKEAQIAGIARGASKAPATGAGPVVDATVVGGFTLDPSQKTGSAGPGAGRSGRSASEVNERIYEQLLERAVDIVARDFAEGLQGELNSIEPLTDTTSEGAQGIWDQIKGLGDQAVEDLAKAIEESQRIEAAIRDNVREGVLGGLYAAANGDGVEYLARTLQSRLMEGIANAITNALMSAQGGGGAGGFLASAAKFLFAPGRASGGHVVGGQPYAVNERGMLEGFVAPQSGKVVPLGNLKAQRSGGGVTVIQPIYNNFKGAVMTEQLLAEFDARSQQHAQTAGIRAAKAALDGSPGRLASFDRLGS